MASVTNLRILFLSTARAATFLETTVAVLKIPFSLFAISLNCSFSTLFPPSEFVLNPERLRRFLKGNIFHFLPAVNLFLPFCLLLFKTWRPSVESMRFLKPCFLALFLFFGWYVRFGMMLEYKKKTNISRGSSFFFNKFFYCLTSVEKFCND